MSALKCCATRAFVSSSGHSGNRHRYGRAGRLGYLSFLIMMARCMLVTNTAGQGVVTTFLFIALLVMFPLSSVLSMYSFATGSITWPALALAFGCAFQEDRLGARGAVKLSVVFTSLLVKAASNQYTQRVRVTDAAQQCDARRL